MQSFKTYLLDEKFSVKSIVNKLKKNRKVINTIKNNAGLTTMKLSTLLLTVPVVKALVGSPDRVQKIATIASSLKSMVLEAKKPK